VIRRHKAGRGELPADGREQVGGSRQEEQTRGSRAAAKHGHKAAVVRGDGGVDAYIVEEFGKRRPRPRVERLAKERAARGLAPCGVSGATQVGAGDPDDPAVPRQMPVVKATVQRRQQFARRKISGAAEQNEVERR